jgi:outer membrane autotransporter protein
VTVETIGVTSSGQPLSLPGTDKSYGNVAIGASAVLPRGFSGFANIEWLFGRQNYTDTRYTLGLRYAF